jgi:serine/threonine-protein kinase
VALLCVVALVVLGWLVAGALRSATSSVTVPNVVGKRVDAATAALSAAGLTAKEQQRAAQQAAGIVIDSSPAQGSKVATGSTVTLVVSSGPQQVTVPKVTGMTLDAATATLSKAGLQVHSTQQDGSAAAGTVLSQDPADGSTVNAGSTVNLVVASGTTTVPSVEGLTVADAQAALQTAGLKASVQSVTQAGALPGVVTNQSPAANRSVPVGTTVVLQVVSNASPSPSPSTGTSPSASPAPSASPSAAGTPKA